MSLISPFSSYSIPTQLRSNQFPGHVPGQQSSHSRQLGPACPGTCLPDHHHLLGRQVLLSQEKGLQIQLRNGTEIRQPSAGEHGQGASMGIWANAMGTFANKAMGSHSPRLLSPVRSDFFFPLCKSQSRKELFICQRLHQRKRNSGTGRHGAITGCPCAQGWEPVQPGHPPATSDLRAKP